MNSYAKADMKKTERKPTWSYVACHCDKTLVSFETKHIDTFDGKIRVMIKITSRSSNAGEEDILTR